MTCHCAVSSAAYVEIHTQFKGIGLYDLPVSSVLTSLRFSVEEKNPPTNQEEVFKDCITNLSSNLSISQH